MTERYILAMTLIPGEFQAHDVLRLTTAGTLVYIEGERNTYRAAFTRDQIDTTLWEYVTSCDDLHLFKKIPQQDAHV